MAYHSRQVDFSFWGEASKEETNRKMSEFRSRYDPITCLSIYTRVSPRITAMLNAKKKHYTRMMGIQLLYLVALLIWAAWFAFYSSDSFIGFGITFLFSWLSQKLGKWLEKRIIAEHSSGLVIELSESDIYDPSWNEDDYLYWKRKGLYGPFKD